MDQAIRVTDATRLPWLEPYRPASSRKSANRAAFAVGAATALAGISLLLFLRDVQPFANQPLPQAQIVLPAPEDIKMTVNLPPLEMRPDASTPGPVRHEARSVRKWRPRRPRIVTALPERDAYEIVMSQQIGSVDLPPESPAISPAPAPAPALPARPAVDPAAEVVKGKTVQLGVYLTPRQAELAWQSAIRDYTFLVTMPKSITSVRWGAKQKTYYRLQLGTPSKRHARQLCGNLRATGRACTVA